MPSNHFILCRSLLLLLSIFSSIRVFSNELALCVMWPKYWSFSLSASPSNGYSGLICFDLLAVVQGTLKNLLQHHSLKASILWHSAFSMVQLSQFSSVQWLSQVWLFVTPWTATHQNPLSINDSLSLLKLMSIALVMPFNHLILFVPLSSCLQSFTASGSYPMSQFFPSGGQSIGVSASASVLPMNIQGWFPLGWTGWISLQSKGLLRVFSNTTAQKHQFFSAQLSL